MALILFFFLNPHPFLRQTWRWPRFCLIGAISLWTTRQCISSTYCIYMYDANLLWQWQELALYDSRIDQRYAAGVHIYSSYKWIYETAGCVFFFFFSLLSLLCMRIFLFLLVSVGYFLLQGNNKNLVDSRKLTPLTVWDLWFARRPVEVARWALRSDYYLLAIAHVTFGVHWQPQLVAWRYCVLHCIYDKI